MSRIRKIPVAFSVVTEALRQISEVINRIIDVTQPFGPVSCTAATTVDPTYATYLCDVSSAGFSVTLPPAAAHKGRRFTVIKIDSSGNTLTLDGADAETINGSSTQTTTTQWAGWTVESDGANWVVIP